MKSMYWVRNDLRLMDNKTLSHFCAKSKSGFFVAAKTPSMDRASTFRRQFYQESLSHFAIALREKNQTLFQTEMFFADFLESYLATNTMEALFYSKEIAVEEIHEEQRVLEICQKHQVQVFGFSQATLIAEEDLPFTPLDLPFVFTNFRKKIESSLRIREPLEIPKIWPESWGESSELNPGNVSSPFSGGESFGLQRLNHYIWETQGVKTYKETRNGLLDFDDSTKFSPWLNLGCLSPRTVMAELQQFEAQVIKNESTYWVLFELLWRDYFKFFSQKFGPKIFQIQGVNALRSFDFDEDPAVFQAWCQGQTSEPFVNAHMRELNATGWMSNRGRQNVASFLIHQLRVPWIWGAAYFEKMLLDYDPDVNWGNWLYLSGQGSDPRARQFDVQRQASLYDPSGEYQRKWS